MSRRKSTGRCCQEEMIQDAKKGQNKRNAVETAVISNATLHGLRASPRASKANPRGVRSSGFGFRGVLGFLVWLQTLIGGHAVQPQGSSQSSSRTNVVCPHGPGPKGPYHCPSGCPSPSSTSRVACAAVASECFSDSSCGACFACEAFPQAPFNVSGLACTWDHHSVCTEAS